MSVPEDKKPIYDDRVNEIVRSLNDGVSREELAIKYKYRDYKSLDMYMRRRNFTWDSKAKNYKPVITRVGKNKFLNEDLHTGKVSRIINSFTEGKDPKTVAEELGFKDHKELAAYMTQKGYEWNNDQQNYVRKSGVVREQNYSSEEVHHTTEGKRKESQEVIYLIKTLYEKLNFKVDDPIVDKVPRYLVKGIAKPKTVQISHLLQQLMEDFSFERNITQREIVETAIIDFFRRYGYKHEIDTLLSK